MEEFWQEIYKITKVFAKASKKSDSKDKLTSTTRRTSSMNTVAAAETDTQDAYSVCWGNVFLQGIPDMLGYRSPDRFSNKIFRENTYSRNGPLTDLLIPWIWGGVNILSSFFSVKQIS